MFQYFSVTVCISSKTGQQLNIVGVTDTEDVWAFWAGNHGSGSDLPPLKSWMPVNFVAGPGTWGPGTLGAGAWARELWARELANWTSPGTFGVARKTPSSLVCPPFSWVMPEFGKASLLTAPHGNSRGPALAVGR